MKLADWCKEHDDKIIKDWTGLDESGSFIDINNTTHGSGRKMKWRCSVCNHGWLATINSRTASKQGCPACYNRNRGKISNKGKVIYGVNDLYTWCISNGDIGNLIKNEWTGISEHSEKVDIHEIASQSNKKMLWVCSKNNEHRWYTKIQKRTLLGSGCPYCCNQKINDENNLYNWCLSNKRTDLINEFTGKDEEGNSVDINKIAKSTHKKVVWRHKTNNGEEHSWVAAVSDRTVNNSRCPLCHGKNILKPGTNDLDTWCNNNKDLGSILREQWVGLTVNNNEISIKNITYGSHTEVYWECNCGNIWITTPLLRTSFSVRCCPKCAKEEAENKRYSKVLSNSTTFSKWCDSNEEIGKILKEECTGIDSEGTKIDMNKVTFGSSKKILWKHITKKGEIHEWLATIHNRTQCKSMCPLCNNKGTSMPEQIIYRCFKQVFNNTISRGKFQGYEFDVTIPDIRVCIEYGSEYYHEGREERDDEKIELCKKHKVRLIRLYDCESNELIIDRDEYRTRIGNNTNKLKYVIFRIAQDIGVDISNINYSKAVEESIRFMRN